MSTDPNATMSLRDVIVDALDEEIHYASPVIDRLVNEVESHVQWTTNGIEALHQVAIDDWQRECERLKGMVGAFSAARDRVKAKLGQVRELATTETRYKPTEIDTVQFEAGWNLGYVAMQHAVLTALAAEETP